MHILIIAPGAIPVPPFVGGSVEHCVYQIAKRLSQTNYVTILSRRHRALPNRSKIGNLTIVRVPSGGQYIWNVVNYIKKKHYDIIQIDNRPKYLPIIRRHFPKTTISLFLHSVTYVNPPMTSRSRAAHDLSAANLIVGNSSSLRGKLKHMFPSHKHKVRYVLLGVNLSQYRPPTQEQKRAAKTARKLGKSFTVVFAGRLIPRKGIPTLMKAMRIVRKTVPAATLVIAGGAGNAAYIRSLKRMASDWRLPTRFLGYVPQRKMHQVYWLGDCFVCPSQMHESFGLVNVEAMAAGTVSIASRIGGIPEIITHGHNGLLVDQYRNPLNFAKQIIKVANQPALAQQLAKQARADTVNKFSWGGTADKLAKIYSNSRSMTS